MISIYKKYLELLERAGKTTYRVCHDTGIPESTMSMFKSRYENGQNPKLSIDILIKLAKYFGVSLDYFVTEDGDKDE